MSKYQTIVSMLSMLLVAGCASLPAPDPPRAPPKLGEDVATCDDLLEGRKSTVRSSDRSTDTPDGWIVLAFSLAGDGQASNVTLIDSEPKGAFVANAAASLRREKYKKGEVRNYCVNTYTFFRRPV